MSAHMITLRNVVKVSHIQVAGDMRTLRKKNEGANVVVRALAEAGL
jgi:hypothetical protein